MRTRLIRPEFWADSRMADLPADTRLTYIGLWCLADDDGYFIWSLRDIAAELYRYESPRKREARVERHVEGLVTADRIKHLGCVVHGVIPSLTKYRIKGGNQSTHIHRVHTDDCLVRTGTDQSLSVSGSVSGSVTVTGSSSFTGSAPAGKSGSIDPKAALDARWGRRKVAHA